MVGWNIHAALNSAFLLQQEIIHRKVALEAGQSLNAKTKHKDDARPSSKPGSETNVL